MLPMFLRSQIERREMLSRRGRPSQRREEKPTDPVRDKKSDDLTGADEGSRPTSIRYNDTELPLEHLLFHPGQS